MFEGYGEIGRYEILEAHYAFCSDYYSGQGDPLYARLCRIGKIFKPGPMWKGRDSLSFFGKMIYDNLVEREEGLRHT